MQADPRLEWQRLTEHYRGLNDDALRDLAADFNDLTDTAQQALRTEMRSRGLGDPQSASPAPVASNVPLPPLAAGSAGTSLDQTAVNPILTFPRPPELVSDASGAAAEADGPVEYTWKTVLCECDTDDQSRQLSEVLRRAGIETWFSFGGYTTSTVPSISRSLQAGGIQVLVAADQLDQARAIAAQPIPREIVEESEIKVPDYTPPSCPKCRAADPVLEGVDPANSWKCEQCGYEWTDSIPAEPATWGTAPTPPS